MRLYVGLDSTDREAKLRTRCRDIPRSAATPKLDAVTEQYFQSSYIWYWSYSVAFLYVVQRSSKYNEDVEIWDRGIWHDQKWGLTKILLKDLKKKKKLVKQNKLCSQNCFHRLAKSSNYMTRVLYQLSSVTYGVDRWWQKIRVILV